MGVIIPAAAGGECGTSNESSGSWTSSSRRREPSGGRAWGAAPLRRGANARDEPLASEIHECYGTSGSGAWGRHTHLQGSTAEVSSVENQTPMRPAESAPGF
jgi:hypothetical protein